jgi:hypothetical protein
MPFKSDKQRRFLFSQKPDVAAKFVRDSKSTGGKMEKHKKHHSAKHMKVMKTAIKKGRSFKSANKKHIKKDGP